jgi:ABC-type transport system involved in multi-copper enzyme maturation permease subunit
MMKGITWIEFYKLSKKKEMAAVIFLFLFSFVANLVLSYKNRADFPMSTYWVILSYLSNVYNFAVPASICMLMASSIAGENSSGNLKTTFLSIIPRRKVYLAKLTVTAGMIITLNLILMMILLVVLSVFFGLLPTNEEFADILIKAAYYHVHMASLSALVLAMTLLFKSSMKAMVFIYILISFSRAIAGTGILGPNVSPFIRTWMKVGVIQTEFMALTMTFYIIVIVLSVLCGLYGFSRYRARA